MDMPENFTLPAGWAKLPVEQLRGLVMVVGAAGVGKSTLTSYLASRLLAAGASLAEVDGDPGQSRLGPPTTLTMRVHAPAPGTQGKDWQRRVFIGALTPGGRLLTMLAGAANLIEAAQRSGINLILYDTSGFIDPRRGALALKQAEVNLLSPQWLIAIQRAGELEAFLQPLELSQRCQVIRLRPAEAARSREIAERQAYRRERFAAYFQGATCLELCWERLPVFPAPEFIPNRLLAFEDRAGFTLGLGLVIDAHRDRRIASIFTPVPDLNGVNSVVLGDVYIDRRTYRDYRMEA